MFCQVQDQRIGYNATQVAFGDYITVDDKIAREWTSSLGPLQGRVTLATTESISTRKRRQQINLHQNIFELVHTEIYVNL